jgi:hypothetical protein
MGCSRDGRRRDRTRNTARGRPALKINALTQGDRALVYMERYVDENTRTYSPVASRNEAPQRYQPRSGPETFDLVTVSAPRARVSIFQADPAPSLLQHYVHPDEVLFAVHPDTWDDPDVEHIGEIRAFPRGETIQVAATASTRTVFATGSLGDVPRHFIKLHYPRNISRFNRRLRRKNICNSVAVTRDLADFRFEKFAYLPDVLGFTFGDEDTAWGYLVREAAPRPFRESAYLIPCFALYGCDLRNPADPPLLVQLIDRLGTDPESFVTEQIMAPIVECWSRVVRERGILLESHAQNTLLELDQNFIPARIVHRDFDVWVDPETRRRAGLDSPFWQVGIDSGRSTEQHYSLVYDHFIGREFLDYLLAVVHRFYGVREGSIRGRVKEVFHRSFSDSRNFFPPRTTFYFSNEPNREGEMTLVDTQQPPQWR